MIFMTKENSIFWTLRFYGAGNKKALRKLYVVIEIKKENQFKSEEYGAMVVFVY